MSSDKDSDGKKVRKTSRFLKVVSFIFQLSLITLLVGATVVISRYWLLNRPTPERQKPRQEAVLVNTLPVALAERQVIVHAMGTVIPAVRIQLAARVSGQITEVSPHFVPGGIIKNNAKILQVDRDDYELALEQQESNLVKAESEVRIEMGQQAVAKSEYELLTETIEAPDLDLLLRKPQLAAKEAAVSIAESAVAKAKLDLERTTITAPFNAIVLTRSVEKGAYVSPGSGLATLVGTDAYWIEVSVPLNELPWITLPGSEDEQGALARVYNPTAWGETSYRHGHVTKLLPDLEPQGRMARVLITVEDPLNLHAEDAAGEILLLDSFVRVLIEGKTIPGIASISRTHLHEGNTVWIMTPEKTLDIRPVNVAWSSQEEVYISGDILDGEALVTTDLASPVDGMLLRTAAPSNTGETTETTDAPDVAQ
ncbi:MAG: Multidrug resistance protein MdtA precursor [Candidatus Hydrogenedentes bacterium ADurb.Bin179]|nr:MAG: Multidrug resistance protein MdtA precursor [Candidatus Hydrogenedentes bacterium ADurb.Bin179]